MALRCLLLQSRNDDTPRRRTVYIRQPRDGGASTTCALGAHRRGRERAIIIAAAAAAVVVDVGSGRPPLVKRQRCAPERCCCGVGARLVGHFIAGTGEEGGLSLCGRHWRLFDGGMVVVRSARIRVRVALARRCAVMDEQLRIVRVQSGRKGRW